MKIIYTQEFNFSQVRDPVKTEACIYKCLEKNKANLPSDLNYVCLPLAWLVNTHGIPFTQSVLDRMEEKQPQQKRYVCQHIQVKSLHFYENIVYTPHCILSDNRRVIPHYNPIIDEIDFVNIDKRKYKFSFVGAYGTHPLRKELEKIQHLPNTHIENTGRWHFEKNEYELLTYKKLYKDILIQTQYALCPPGTGPSTIRLYEAMAAGCVPIVFNDVKIPKCIEEYVIRLSSVEDILNDELPPATNKRVKEMHSIYWKHLSNYNMYNIILNDEVN